MQFFMIRNMKYFYDYTLTSTNGKPFFFKYLSKKRVKKEIQDMFSVDSVDKLERLLSSKNLKANLVFRTSYFDYYEIKTLNLYGGKRGDNI